MNGSGSIDLNNCDFFPPEKDNDIPNTMTGRYNVEVVRPAWFTKRHTTSTRVRRL
jgi:hypothetical protein